MGLIIVSESKKISIKRGADHAVNRDIQKNCVRLFFLSMDICRFLSILFLFFYLEISFFFLFF